MRLGQCAVIALACGGLAGCQAPIEIRVHNATGAVVDLLPIQYDGWPRTLHIKPGRSARRSATESKLIVATAGCRAHYLLPEMGSTFPWTIPGQGKDESYPYPVEVQLEPDFTLYLLPPRSERTLPVEWLKTRQAHGYPVKPKSLTCGRTGS